MRPQVRLSLEKAAKFPSSIRQKGPPNANGPSWMVRRQARADPSQKRFRIELAPESLRRHKLAFARRKARALAKRVLLDHGPIDSLNRLLGSHDITSRLLQKTHL